mgnify:CR=1 FL=1
MDLNYQSFIKVWILNNKCIFSAPYSFLGSLRDEFNTILKTEFREIWDTSDLIPSNNLNAWVVNPGQGFIINK